MASAKEKAEKKEALLVALEKSLGVVDQACKKAGVPRTTFYRWKEEDPDFAAACAQTSEIALDFVESKLFLAIQADNVTAMIFYLKTKGKERGYVERQEFAGTQTIAPLEVSLKLSTKDLENDEADPKDPANE